MLALVLDDVVRLRTDYPQPRRQPGEALLRVRMAGICDTDLQLARGYMSYRGVLGHEFVGEVTEADSSELIGRRVVADINAGCGRCPECRQGDMHHCPNRTVLGISGRDGALAEWVTLPERCLVTVPDAVDDARAVFCEPLAAALHVVDEAKPNDRALVLGDGKLGQLIARALSGSGVHVTLIGHHRSKLELAEQAGISVLLESELSERERAPLVVEATGSAAGLRRALELTEPRGTIVMKTTIAEPIQVDLAPLVIHEIKLVGSRCGNIGRAVEALATGRVDPTPLIQERFPLAEASAALERAGQRGAMKVLIETSA